MKIMLIIFALNVASLFGHSGHVQANDQINPHEKTPNFASPACWVWSQCKTKKQRTWFNTQKALTSEECFKALRTGKKVQVIDGVNLYILKGDLWTIKFDENGTGKMLCNVFPDVLYEKVAR